MSAKQVANITIKHGHGGGGIRPSHTVVYDVVVKCEMKDSNGLVYALKAKDEFKVWLWGDSTYRAEAGNIPAVIDRALLCDLETTGHIKPRDIRNTLVPKAYSPKPPPIVA